MFVDRHSGIRGPTRISHLFLFGLPRYHKRLGPAHCVVNIVPPLAAKRDILTNAIDVMETLGIARLKVSILAALETVSPAIPASVDADALVMSARQSVWPGAQVEGAFGRDSAISAEATRIERSSRVSVATPTCCWCPTSTPATCSTRASSTSTGASAPAWCSAAAWRS